MSKALFQDSNYVQKFIYGNLPCDVETMGIFKAWHQGEEDEQVVIINESRWGFKSSGQKDSSGPKSSRASTRARSQRVSRRPLPKETEPQSYFTITPRLRALRSNVRNTKPVYWDEEDPMDTSLANFSQVTMSKNALDTVDL